MAAGVEYWLAVCTVDARSGCWVADAGVPTLYDVSTVLVSVNDVNDNQPIITGPAPSASSSNNTTPSAIIELPPSVDVGHVVTHVTASDDDVGDNARLSYSIVGDVIGSAAELFAIDEQTGEVTVAAPLPHSSHDASYEVVVAVSDAGSPRLTSQMTLHVRVSDSTAPRSVDMSRRSALHGSNTLVSVTFDL